MTNSFENKKLVLSEADLEGIQESIVNRTEASLIKAQEESFDKEKVETKIEASKLEHVPEHKAGSTTPPPLPEILTLKSDLIEAKLSTLGVTREQLVGIKGFENIAGSEGRVLAVINNIEQIRLKEIDEKAREGSEQHVRTSGSLTGRIWRGLGFNRRREIEDRKIEEGKKPFDVSAHSDEIKGLVDIVSAGPEVTIRKDADGKFIGLSTEYINEVKGSPEYTKAYRFNDFASKFAQLPPKYTWEKYSTKEQKSFKETSDEYEKEKNNLLRMKGEKGMREVNDAEFQVRMAQTMNAYPNGAAELTRLAEAKGWDKQISLLRAQIGPGAVGFATGLGARFATKSIVASTLGAVALPLTALGLAGAFGYMRGKEKAQESLVKQDELMRIGMEQDKSAGKGTKGNFVKVEHLTKQISFLEDKLVMDYKTYLNTTKDKPMSLDAFNKDKAVAAERLQVRLEYTKQKVEEGKVVFGKNADAIIKQYELIQSMSRASGEISLVSDMVGIDDGRQFANAKGKTRRSRLANLLEHAESKIEKNRSQYVRDRAAISGLVGVATAGLGYEIGGVIHDYFGAHGADEIHKQAQLLRVNGDMKGAAQLEKMTEDGVKNVVVHDKFEKLSLELDEKLFQKKMEVLEIRELAIHRGIDIPKDAEVQYTKQFGKVKSFVWQGKTYEVNTDTNMFPKGEPVVSDRPPVGAKINRDALRELQDEKVSVEQQEKELVESIIKAKKQNISLDINTQSEDITADLPRSSYSEQLKEFEYAVPRGVTPEDVIIPENVVEKPFIYKLATENQSREYAMIQYLREQGMGEKEAGRKAHLLMKEIFGPKGERGLDWVHKGDNINIFEKDGKLHLEVNPENTPVLEKAPILSNVVETPKVVEPEIEILPTSATENPPQPNLDPNLNSEKTVIPQPKSSAPILTSEVTPSPTPSPTPEVIQAVQEIAPYEVKAPTSLPQVINDLLKIDGRMETMTDLQKDQVVYDVLVNHFLEKEHTIPGYMKSVGISSGDIFDIQSGTLKLGDESKDVLGDSIQRVKDGAVTVNVQGFRANFGKVSESLKGYVSADMNSTLIVEELRKARK